MDFLFRADIAPPGQEGWLRDQVKMRSNISSRGRGGGSRKFLEQPPRRFAPPLLARRGYLVALARSTIKADPDAMDS
jgi:hypothetical protein